MPGACTYLVFMFRSRGVAQWLDVCHCEHSNDCSPALTTHAGSGIFTDNNAGGNKSRRMAAEEAPVLATEVAAAVPKKAHNRRMRL